METARSVLARVELAPFGERVVSAAVVLGSGRPALATIHEGLVEPVDELREGARVRVEVTVRRAGWLGWLVGSTEHVQTVVETPVAHPRRSLYFPRSGSAVGVVFDSPVTVVSVQLGSGPRRVLTIHPARRIVSLGVIAAGIHSAGSALVSGAPRPWEKLPPPVMISWFPAGPAPEVIARPAPAATIDPTTPIVLTFSRTVASVLGSRRPTVWPHTAGAWHEPNAHTLAFEPSGIGFSLGARVHLGLTRPFRVATGTGPMSVRTLSWQVAPGSRIRLVQLLAQLGYLPLSFHPSGTGIPAHAAAQIQAALAPPPGSFSWRYRAPAALRALWQSPDERTVMIQGALIAFESVNDLVPENQSTPAIWNALLDDMLNTKTNPNGYSYVHVSETLPETLTLWHNGHVVLQTPANTGIPQAPTALGTYPVYLHLTSTTMTGTNPDGVPYSDPGVPWVNYFNGGDAVHGFPRADYGYPQSLGCVELPIPTAAIVYPYIQVGTLVTIAA
jgi:hypothetical protein